MNKRDEDPVFIVHRCDCGKPGCRQIMIGFVRPVIKMIEESPGDPLSGEAAHCGYLPLEAAQSLVNKIRHLAAERGVIVT